MRARIAEILKLAQHCDFEYSEIADDILSLPSGLEAVSTCNHYAKGTADDLCFACHGTGEIIRDLSLGEVNNAVVTGDLWRDGAGYFLYSTGERVRVKK